MQSWGESRDLDKTRHSANIPTKSGIVGMCAAGLGLSRDECYEGDFSGNLGDSIGFEDLTKLKFGVLVIKPGIKKEDFHVVMGWKSVRGGGYPEARECLLENGKWTRLIQDGDQYVTYREYLEDAEFIVGLEGEEGILSVVEEALRRPWFPLSYGRRANPVCGNLVCGVFSGGLEEVLVEKSKALEAGSMELHLEGKAEGSLETAYRYDYPLSYEYKNRRYRRRLDSRKRVFGENIGGSGSGVIEHDAWGEVGSDEHNPWGDLESEVLS
jgi:CRISPR system Cascade subunit CasD